MKFAILFSTMIIAPFLATCGTPADSLRPHAAPLAAITVGGRIAPVAIVVTIPAGDSRPDAFGGQPEALRVTGEYIAQAEASGAVSAQTAVFDEQGRFLGICVQFHDVQARAAAELELRTLLTGQEGVEVQVRGTCQDVANQRTAPAEGPGN